MRSGVPNDRQQRAAANAETLRRAQFAVQNDHPAEAERLAGEILKTSPGDAEATKVLGYALMMRGRGGDAAGVLEKAARSGRDPELETQLAIALRQAGRPDEALPWLKRAIKRKPPFLAAFHEYGLALKALQRYDEAIDVLKQGLEAAPMMVEMATQLGRVYEAVNDRANARKYFAQAHAVNPRQPEALHALGAALMDDHEFAQAAELYRHALTEDPADAAARIGLGNCLLNLGQADAAFACLRAATARGPQFYGKALKIAASSPRGRFWLRPSAAAKFFKGE
jgi:tetratricopeptide (TPR) repeat protein